MKRNARLFLMSVVMMIGLFLVACDQPKDEYLVRELNAAAVCGVPADATLLGFGQVPLGMVTISNDGYNLYVRYSTTGNWHVSSLDVAVAPDLAGIPQRNGVPVPELFRYRETLDPMMDVYTLEIPLSEVQLGPELHLAVHAELVQVDRHNRVIRRTNAWSDGLRFSGRSWETYTLYQQQNCDVVPPGLLAGSFRTQLQSQWGQDPTEWGAIDGVMEPPSLLYLTRHFGRVFPAGLVVGAGPKRVVLTSAAAVISYLPDGAEPLALRFTSADPERPVSGLAGQLVALTLNVRFDRADPNFSRSSIRLGNLLVNDVTSFYYNLPVATVLQRANLVLAGEPGHGTLYQTWHTVKSINEDFVDGVVDHGFLRLPKRDNEDPE